jgi:hypothetical protein
MPNLNTPYPPDDPVMVAWKAYKASEEFANTRRWATNPEHTDGSLWAAFRAGFDAATERKEAPACPT